VRFYNVVITNASGTVYTFKSLQGAFGTNPATSLTSLLPNGPQTPQQGLTNPAALQVEFNFPLGNGANPGANCFLRIWGLGIEDLNSAANLNPKSGAPQYNIQVFGGMAQGLPLANPAQAGLLVQGTIQQAFGNWQGTNQTLDIIIQAGPVGVGSVRNPQNFPFNWIKGTPLSRAIGNTLGIAMPGMPQQINISPNLVSNMTLPGQYESLDRFKEAMTHVGQGILGANYFLNISVVGNTIKVYDNTTMGQGGVTQINFADLIGQPTWDAPNQMTFKTVMRADLHQGDMVNLPISLVSQSANSFPGTGGSNTGKLTFSGQFRIGLVYIWGVSRQPDGDAWCSVFTQCIPTGSGTTGPT
jgi:hypothetical protein